MAVEPWRIHLLGELRAVCGDTVVTRFRTQKVAGLFAYLAFYRGRSHPRETLLSLFWPESDLSAARNSLSVALASLRQQIEPPATVGTSPVGAFLVADRTFVSLRADAFTTDTEDFEATLARAAASATTASDTLSHFVRAEQLYTGELLPGFFEDWIFPERERLATIRLQGLRRLTALLMQARDFDRALGYAHRAVLEDPVSEEARRLLMRVYANTGQATSVMAQFRELEKARAGRGEPPPSADTHELALRLSQGSDKEAIVVPAPVVSTVTAMDAAASLNQSPPTTHEAPSPVAVAGLPLVFTRFFGRADELQRVRTQLGAPESPKYTRLLTLTGMGGNGKTRLAIEAASRIRDTFPGGVYFAALDAVDRPDRLAESLCNVLKLPPATRERPLEALERFLSEAGPCLLVLDNLEQLLGHGPLDRDGAAALLQSLLRTVPTLSLLCTSRQSLGIPEESVLAVPPLPTPPDERALPGDLLQFAAVQLWVDRARSRKVDFQVTERNGPFVAGLCTRLDGVPLALELAAAWAKVFTPSQILERLRNFSLLESRNAAVAPRHRSLRATVAWSYSLLSPEEQQLFTQLAVFHGGCTVEAACAVCGDAAETGRTLTQLSRLDDASLLIMEATPLGDGESMRVRLQEPLREFAREHLVGAEKAAVETRHLNFYRQFLESVEAQGTGPQQDVSFDRIEADHDNLRAVLARHANDATGLRFVGLMARFWAIRGHVREGEEWLTRVLAATTMNNADSALALLRAKALNGAGTIAYHKDDLDAAFTLYRESRSLQEKHGAPRDTAIAIQNMGNVAYRRGDYPLATEQYQSALSCFRTIGDRWGIASTLGSLGNVAQAIGDYAAARALQEESLVVSREIGETRMTAYTLHNLGNLAAEEGDAGHARALYKESLALKQSLGDRRGVVSLQLSLGFLALQESEDRAAQSLFETALPVLRNVGSQLGLITALDGLAWCRALSGNVREAAQLWGAVAAARTSLHLPRSPQEQAAYERLLTNTRDTADKAGQNFAQAWDDGAALSVDQVVTRLLGATPATDF